MEKIKSVQQTDFGETAMVQKYGFLQGWKFINLMWHLFRY